jgi:hypothetical protein
MDLHIQCECGERIDVTPAMAGSKVRCGCGRENVVPPLSKLEPERPAVRDEEAPCAAIPNFPVAGIVGAILLDAGGVLMTQPSVEDVAWFPVLLGSAILLWDAIGRVRRRIVGASAAILVGAIVLHASCQVDLDHPLSPLLLLAGLVYVGGGAFGRWRQRRRRRFQFSVGTMLLAIAAAALLIGSAVYLFQDRDRMEPIDRSWSTGTVDIGIRRTVQSVGPVIDVSWPDASPGLYVRFKLWLVNQEGDHMPIESGTDRLQFFGTLAGTVRYPPPVGEPFRAVCDYEIWEGPPRHGKLLAKNSAFSDWYEE